MRAAVLILDGDIWRREALAAALAYEGFHAVATDTIGAALSLLAGSPFHLVLLDISAPKADGWAALERLTRIHPGLPVIVLLSEEDHPSLSTLSGRASVVAKPLNFSALLQTVRSETATIGDLLAEGIRGTSIATGPAMIP